QAAFPRARATTEDFKNETSAVDNFDPPGALEIALLHWTDRMVDDDEPRLVNFDLMLEFVDFAAAERRRWTGARHRHHDAGTDVEFDRLGEAHSFRQAILTGAWQRGWAMQTVGRRRRALALGGKHGHDHERSHRRRRNVIRPAPTSAGLLILR